MNIYLALLLFILLGFYCLDFLVEYLNLRAIRTELAPEFQGIYDKKRYAKSQKYLRVCTCFHLWKSTITTFLVLCFLFLGGLQWADALVRSLSLSPLWTGVLYMAFLSFLSFLLSLPFSLYDTFVIEEKFAFNKTTLKTYTVDIIRVFAIILIFGIPFLLAILWLFTSLEDKAWLYAWGLTFLFSLLVQTIYPQYILPLFNILSPLPEGELKEKVENFAKKENFTVSGIFVMDGSLRTTKANAFFSGFGRFRRIVLFDTLIKNHSVDELVAVLAHEIGHAKLHHIKKFAVLKFFSLGIFFYFVSLFMNNSELFAAFQVENLSVYVSLVLIVFFYKPISFALDILKNIFSRKYEYEADAYAAQSFLKPEALILALKRLSVENLSNLYPHPWKIFLEYSHPPVLLRINRLREYCKEAAG